MGRDWRLKVLCIFQEPSSAPTLRSCPSVRKAGQKQWPPAERALSGMCLDSCFANKGKVLTTQGGKAPRPPPHRKPALVTTQDPPTSQAPRIPQADACFREGWCVDGSVLTGVLGVGQQE